MLQRGKSACLQNKEMTYNRLGKMLNYYQESIHHCTIKVIRNGMEYMTTRRTRNTFK